MIITYKELSNAGINILSIFQHILRAQNILADKLARGARILPSSMVYVDSVLSRWLSDQESS